MSVVVQLTLTSTHSLHCMIVLRAALQSPWHLLQSEPQLLDILPVNSVWRCGQKKPRTEMMHNARYSAPEPTQPPQCTRLSKHRQGHGGGMPSFQDDCWCVLPLLWFTGLRPPVFLLIVLNDTNQIHGVTSWGSHLPPTGTNCQHTGPHTLTLEPQVQSTKKGLANPLWIYTAAYRWHLVVS